MGNSGPFYFVENFNILAVFPPNASFVTLEVGTDKEMSLSARMQHQRAAGVENPDKRHGKVAFGYSKWCLFGF